MQFFERTLQPQDVPQEVCAGQVAAMCLAARSMLTAAVRSVVAEDGHLSASEKQTLSALPDALSLAEGESQGHDVGEAVPATRLRLTKTRPLPMSERQERQKLVTGQGRRDAT